MSIAFYDKIISHKRLGPTTTPRTLNEEFTSDKNRIIFSSPFRRLQQKTQVFSLETNASVRSRLTHTLEVATIGISIAERVLVKLKDQEKIRKELILPFIKIVENACLIHDIGNPPFGHFAEEAIKEWFRNYWKDSFLKASKLHLDINDLEINNSLINDFLHFDGNPQGLRIITKLQDIPEIFHDVGMNLTFAQIAAVIKYVASPNNIDKSNSLYKKAGYFFSEKDKVEKIKVELNITNRYPLTYIMEAADDISYCLSDIEDGIEKNILTSRYFFEKLDEECQIVFGKEDYSFHTLVKLKKTKYDFFKLKIDLIRKLENHSIDRYIEKHEEIMDGTLPELIEKESPEGMFLKCLKTISRKYLFRSKEAENKELSGFHAIYGILEKYRCLLDMEHSKFFDLVRSKEDLDKILGAGLDLQWRLFNRLPKKYIDAYKYEYEELKKSCLGNETKFIQYEWFNRAHLIVDYVSGMTDNFVIETYNLLYGIKL